MNSNDNCRWKTTGLTCNDPTILNKQKEKCLVSCPKCPRRTHLIRPQQIEKIQNYLSLPLLQQQQIFHIWKPVDDDEGRFRLYCRVIESKDKDQDDDGKIGIGKEEADDDDDDDQDDDQDIDMKQSMF